MTTWLFDLGNSRLKCAPMGDDGRVVRAALREIPHDGSALSMADGSDLPSAFDTAFVASVAGDALTTSVLDALTRHCTRITRVRTQRACAGVRIAYADPQRFGVDSFLALLAAHARDRQPSLVVGVGTALTIDLLAGDGRHVGGRIAPSPTLMREALQARAPRLPASGGDYVEFATDTEDALRSGCDGAAVALVLRSLAQAASTLGTPPRLLLHGGGSAALLPQLRDAEPAPALVLEGLACWARATAAPAPVQPTQAG
jgi:type III pantothenate kinase